MPHILVIDDDPTLRLIVCRTLEKQGYTVAQATNGEQGLALARQILPALVICDWMMPVMDGIEVCRRLKQDQRLASTFVILLTSRSKIDDRVHGLDAGADEFLLKPLDPQELTARVKAGLRLYKALQDQQLLNQELQQVNQELEIQKELYRSELKAGAAYVESMLPKPEEVPLPIDYEFIPSIELGGDFLDYLWVDEQTLVIYLLDVSGHGLKPTVELFLVLTLLRAQMASLHDMLKVQSTSDDNESLSFDCRQPKQVLETLNNLFLMENNDQQYFTIWYGVYHKATRELEYASGGHPPALLVSHQDAKQIVIEELKTKRLPIGFFKDSKYECNRCLIEAKSTLYIYSDGIYEIQQPDGKMWGLSAFKKLLEKAHHQPNMSLSEILEDTQKICQNSTFNDDRSLLRVRFD